MENIGRIISNRDVDKLFRLLELAGNNSFIYYISEKEIEEIRETLKFLEYNNGIVNENIHFTQEQIDKINNYLTLLNENTILPKIDNSESLSLNEVNKMLETLSDEETKIDTEILSNISNEDAEYTKCDKSVLTQDEKNTLIASYGKSDIELFAIRLDYLNVIYITGDDNKEKYFNHGFSHRSIASLGENLGKTLAEIGDNYTLLKYLGNNRFEEFYTGKTVLIYREAVEDKNTFLTKLEYYKENPLCILIGLKNLEIASNSIEEKIIANAKNRDKIVSFIEKATTIARRELDKDLIYMIEEDRMYADEANKVYEFKKVMK